MISKIRLHIWVYGKSKDRSLAFDGSWDGDGMQDLSISPQIELKFPRYYDPAVDVE
jgi:hypothetical protein